MRIVIRRGLRQEQIFEYSYLKCVIANEVAKEGEYLFPFNDSNHHEKIIPVAIFLMTGELPYLFNTSNKVVLL